MNETKLGQLLTGTEERDAIHIAVAPVIAAVQLRPGHKVGLLPGSKNTVTPHETAIGVIDPFLIGTIEPGQRCWLLLYPQTITSLRHEWIHPSFPTENKKIQPSSSQVAPTESPVNRSAAGVALDMLSKHNYDDMPIMADALEEAGYPSDKVEKIRKTKPWREYNCIDRICTALGEQVEPYYSSWLWISNLAEQLNQTFSRVMQAADDYHDEQEYTYDNTEIYKELPYSTWKKFWKHYGVLTGKEVEERESNFFTCSC